MNIKFAIVSYKHKQKELENAYTLDIVSYRMNSSYRINSSNAYTIEICLIQKYIVSYIYINKYNLPNS